MSSEIELHLRVIKSVKNIATNFIVVLAGILIISQCLFSFSFSTHATAFDSYQICSSQNLDDANHSERNKDMELPEKDSQESNTGETEEENIENDDKNLHLASDLMHQLTFALLQKQGPLPIAFVFSNSGKVLTPPPKG